MSSGEAVRLYKWAGFALLMLLSAISSFAQGGQGKVSGLVTDPAGAIVLGAQVVLHNNATGLTQHTVTSAAGLYTFPSVNLANTTLRQARKGLPVSRMSTLR
jgi:Carboxypeptidase regulatory-like domain